MSGWDTYIARAKASGVSKRDRALIRTQDYITNKVGDSLSHHDVVINGEQRKLTILNQKGNMALKRICTMPGEKLPHGGLVEYADNRWLITEVEAEDEVYAAGNMQQCNYLLKWINHEGKLIEKWCIVEDGTKYLVGEQTESMMSIGAARIAVTIGKDDDTIHLSRGRRFLIDDMSSPAVLAYQITKPNKLFNIYNGKGVFRFILNEDNITKADNIELRIADYYNWEPAQIPENAHEDPEIPLEEIVEEAHQKPQPDDNKEVWL